MIFKQKIIAIAIGAVLMSSMPMLGVLADESVTSTGTATVSSDGETSSVRVFTITTDGPATITIIIENGEVVIEEPWDKPGEEPIYVPIGEPGIIDQNKGIPNEEAELAGRAALDSTMGEGIIKDYKANPFKAVVTLIGIVLMSIATFIGILYLLKEKKNKK